jgi:hypothetical protein
MNLERNPASFASNPLYGYLAAIRESQQKKLGWLNTQFLYHISVHRIPIG